MFQAHRVVIVAQAENIFGVANSLDVTATLLSLFPKIWEYTHSSDCSAKKFCLPLSCVYSDRSERFFQYEVEH
jgi:hypothetical protein